MISDYEAQYRALVDCVAQAGEKRTSRAGNTKSIFGTILRIDSLRKGVFPILTARKIFYKPVLGELAAFLRGATDLALFKEYGCNYWDANAEAWSQNDGLPQHLQSVGQIYGAQWRDWAGLGSTDQIKNLIDSIWDNPTGRRHLLTTYDPSETWQCLPPCHLLAQFNVTNDGHLDCCVYMRSVDLCLGLPSDVILYATLLLLIAQQTRLAPGNLTFMMGDTHIYENHLEVWEVQRMEQCWDLPLYKLHSSATVDTFYPEQLQLLDYHHGEKLVYPFNV
jgi:thymidylate synthase